MDTQNELLRSAKPGLVLSGGGARGAYQAGVLRALYELNQKFENPNLFKIITGVSAGAINAGYLASMAQDLDKATSELCSLWQNITSEQVFKTSVGSVALNATKLFRGLTFGGLGGNFRIGSASLLDTSPLKDLLQSRISTKQIRENIANGHIQSISLTATDYTTAMGITFVESKHEIKMWSRSRRHSVLANIEIEHIMASSSIPVFFPPVSVNGREYGDGCLRNQSPLSPAIHLGADQLIVIGVRTLKRKNLENSPPMNATLGRIAGVIVNAIFLDAIESDLERLHLINQALGFTPSSQRPPELRPVKPFYLRPSKDISEEVAHKHRSKLPKVFKYLMGGLGKPEETKDLLSFLLFDKDYCSELVDLGYQDTKARAGELSIFLSAK